MSERNNSPKNKKTWEQIVFGTIEKLAQAPGKLKDPKETVVQAVEWVKATRDDVQQKFISDMTEKVASIDWGNVSKEMADHIAENYDLELKVSFRRKKPTSKVVEDSPEEPSSPQKAE